MNRFLLFILIAAFGIMVCNASFGQESVKKAAVAKPTPVAQNQQAPAQAPAARPIARPTFGVVFGSITKIDTTDPAKPKLEVKSDTDGSVHNVELTPWTNVTKVTDVSELKKGDTVRLMTRKIEDKEVAMTVVFGKIRNIMAPRAVAQPPTSAKPVTGQPAKK